MAVQKFLALITSQKHQFEQLSTCKKPSQEVKIRIKSYSTWVEHRNKKRWREWERQFHITPVPFPLSLGSLKEKRHLVGEGEKSEHPTSPWTPAPGLHQQAKSHKPRLPTHPTFSWLPWPQVTSMTLGFQQAPTNRGSKWTPTNSGSWPAPAPDQLLWP